MDIVTQGLAGSVLAQSAAGKTSVRWAALAGLAAGLAPDLDVLIQSANDPLLQLEYHRHFSHALLMAPFGGLLIAAILWLLPSLRRGQLPFWRLWCFTTLGFACGGLLDACTSYGTHLLWPFSDRRLAWNIIAIIDPLFTLPLFIGGIMAWRRRQPWVARASALLALGYLGFGLVQQQRATALVDELTRARGHSVEASVVKPTLGNTLLWRSVYRAGDRYYVDAVRVGLSSEVFVGDAVPVFNLARDLPKLARRRTSSQYRDLRRFERLSEGFLVRHPARPNVIGDIRYAMLPDSVAPLWGITIDPDQPQQHVAFQAYRYLSETDRQRFLAMLFGG